MYKLNPHRDYNKESHIAHYIDNEGSNVYLKTKICKNNTYLKIFEEKNTKFISYNKILIPKNIKESLISTLELCVKKQTSANNLVNLLINNINHLNIDYPEYLSNPNYEEDLTKLHLEESIEYLDLLKNYSHFETEKTSKYYDKCLEELNLSYNTN